jgi:glutathione S-transferase
MNCTLYIGNKNYSSWSLRPWLCLRWARIPFEEKLIRLDQPGYGEGRIGEILAVSPTGRVPALQVGATSIWDSMAIAEWAAENTVAAPLWPEKSIDRAQARAATAEMHSGFAAMRRDLSMNIKRRCPAQTWKDDTKANIARIEELWTQFRTQHRDNGPWLFGARSIADAFYTPVATRMRTYSVALNQTAQTYCDTLLADADFKEWESECIPESWDKSGYSVIDKLHV